MSLCLHWPIIACNHALLAPSALRGSNGLLLTTARWKRCGAQGALSEFMRKTPLTTEHPTSDRMLGRSEGVDSGIRDDLP